MSVVGFLLLLLSLCFSPMIYLSPKGLNYLHKGNSPHWWASILGTSLLSS